MSNGAPGWITVLLRLPVFHNPAAAGHRAPVEDGKFLDTAEELALRFGGGTLFIFRDDPPRGFWWDRGMVDRDVLALIEVDVPIRRSHVNGCEHTRATFCGNGSSRKPSI